MLHGFRGIAEGAVHSILIYCEMLPPGANSMPTMDCYVVEVVDFWREICIVCREPNVYRSWAGEV